MRSLNIDVRFGVNAEKLHKKIKERRFKRIHFNFPYYAKEKDEAYTSDENNRKLIENFFKSASKLQKTGDRIYIVLPKSNDKEKRQGVVHAIYSACTKAGYQYIKKRPFSKTNLSEKKKEGYIDLSTYYTSDGQKDYYKYCKKRYPKYKHVLTQGGNSEELEKTRDSREYIFEKTDLLLPKKQYAQEIIKTLKSGKENIKEEEKLWLELTRDLASYGPESKPGLQSKFLFGPKGRYKTEEFQSITGINDNESNTIRLEDVLDFLFSERLVTYLPYYRSGYNGDYVNHAFYPLPELKTDTESSDYDSDSNNEFFLQSKSKKDQKIIKNGDWEFKNVASDGNCFYRATALQLGNDFINMVPNTTAPHDYLRLLIQGNSFEDGEWAGTTEIFKLIERLNVIVAIVSTNYLDNGFRYYYMNNNNNIVATQNPSDLPSDQRIIRLAFTGNHYMSVRNFPNQPTFTQNEETINNTTNFIENTGPNMGIVRNIK